MTQGKGNVIKLPRSMRGYIGIVEQADADDMYGDIHPATFGRRDGQAFSDHGRADLKIRPNDARFGDNPLAPPGQGASLERDYNLEEFADSEVTPQLDQLHQALTKAGLSDLEIRKSGVELTHTGKQKIAGRLGVSIEEVDLLINSLVQNLRDTDASESDALLSDYYGGMAEGTDAPIWPTPDMSATYAALNRRRDHAAEAKAGRNERARNRRANAKEITNGDVERARRSSKGEDRPFESGTMIESRFSVEPDALGNVTIRDAETGKERFIQGSEASALRAKLGDGAQNDQILAPLMEAEMNAETNSGFHDEIKADSGSYNFTWKGEQGNGTGTVLYKLKNNKPSFKMISVRTMAGEDILDSLSPNEYKEILDQAKDFIQDA